MRVLRKYVSVYDLIKMFLIEIINREASGYSQIGPVRTGDVIIQSDAQKDVHRLCRFGYLAKERPVVASHSCASLVCGVDQKDQRQLACLLRSRPQYVGHRTVELRTIES